MSLNIANFCELFADLLKLFSANDWIFSLRATIFNKVVFAKIVLEKRLNKDHKEKEMI